MGGVKVSGQGGGLNFTANLDISQALKNSETLKRAMSDLAVSSDGITASRKSQASADNAAGKAITEYQAKQLALRKTMVDALATSEALRQKNLELDASYKAGRITAQEQAAAERQLRKDRLALAEATRAARAAQVAATGSYDEANAKLLALGRSIKAAEGGFASTNPVIRAQINEYNQLNQSLKAFDAQMGNHQRNVGGYSEALSGFGSQLKSLALNYVSAYAILAGLNHIIKTNAEISDSFADVRRTAGLSADEVENLSNQLKKIDTRTSLKGLLDIAVIGGQLGIARDQLAGFTKAIDQLSVTLSGEISGGAEAVASALGKINGVFKVQEKEGTDVERSFNKTGSAILALGQAGLATGEFLQDFGLRTAGVANTAKISLPIILAYGAVLEETGSSAEVAGTALVRLIGNLASKREQFFTIAKIADSTLTLKSFTDLINTDANAALQKFFQGLNAGGKDLTSFTDLIDKIGLKGGPAKNAIIALAQNQALLNERINESKTAYDAGTLSAEQFELKNNNLAGSVAKLGNQFEKTTSSGAIASFFKEIIDWCTKTLSALDKVVNSKSFAELTDRLIAGQKNLNPASFALNAFKKNINFDAKNDATAAFTSSQKASASVTDPFSENTKVLSNNLITLKAAYKDAYHAYSVYYDGVKNGTLINSKEQGKSLDDYKKNAEDILAITKNVQQRYNAVIAVKKEDIQVNEEQADSELKTAAAIHTRIKELQNDALAIPANKANDIKRIQALKATLREVSGSSKLVDTALNGRNALQTQIDALTKKGTDKELTADDQQVESVKDKYAKMLEAAKKFNNDPENKKKGLRVDGGGLVRAQSNELTGLRDKQDTEKLKITLDKQKKLYDDYEAYKTEVGEDKAKKRFAGLIDIDKTYLQSLKAQEQALTTPDAKAKGGVDSDPAATQLQLKEVRKRIADETYAESAKYANLLKQLQNYQDQAKILTANYEEDKARIASNPLNLSAEQLTEQYKVLKEKFDKNISALSVSELTNSVDWSNLFSNLGDLATKDIETLLKTIESKFKDLSKTMNPIDLATTRKKLQEARDLLIKDNPFKQVGLAIQEVFNDSVDGIKKSDGQIKTDWDNLGKSTAAAFKFVSDAVDSCDILKGALGEVAGTALSSLAAIAAVAVAVSTAIKTAEKASIILAVISAALVVVQAIASVFKSIFGAHDKNIEKKIKGYQSDLDALDRGFKQLERDVTNAVGNDIYADQTKEIENLQAQQAKLIQQRDAEASKKKADQGKIDDYNSKINDIPNQIADINQAITDMLVQTTFKDLSSSLSDAFTSAFANGEDSLAKLNEAFNQVIANAVKKGLELKFLQPVVDGFIKDFAAYMNSNGNSALGFDFTKYKDLLQVAGDNFTAGLEPFKEFFTPASTPSTSTALSKSITQITSDQANALEGINRGTYDQTKQVVTQATIGNALLTNIGKSIGDMYKIGLDTFNSTVEIEKNTRRGADNTDGLIPALKEIIKNTTGGTSLRGSGLG